MVKSTGRERRKFARLDKDFRVEYKLMDFTQKAASYEKSKIKNISGNGLLFETDTQLDIGDLVQLKVFIMGIDKEKSGFFKFDQTAVSEPLTILARVVRVEEIAKARFYEIGVEFKNIYEDDSQALVKYIEKKLPS